MYSQPLACLNYIESMPVNIKTKKQTHGNLEFRGGQNRKINTCLTYINNELVPESGYSADNGELTNLIINLVLCPAHLLALNPHCSDQFSVLKSYEKALENANEGGEIVLYRKDFYEPCVWDYTIPPYLYSTRKVQLVTFVPKKSSKETLDMKDDIEKYQFEQQDWKVGCIRVNTTTADLGGFTPVVIPRPNSSTGSGGKSLVQINQQFCINRKNWYESIIGLGYFENVKISNLIPYKRDVIISRIRSSLYERDKLRETIDYMSKSEIQFEYIEKVLEKDAKSSVDIHVIEVMLISLGLSEFEKEVLLAHLLEAKDIFSKASDFLQDVEKKDITNDTSNQFLTRSIHELYQKTENYVSVSFLDESYRTRRTNRMYTISNNRVISSAKSYLKSLDNLSDKLSKIVKNTTENEVLNTQLDKLRECKKYAEAYVAHYKKNRKQLEEWFGVEKSKDENERCKTILNSINYDISRIEEEVGRIYVDKIDKTLKGLESGIAYYQASMAKYINYLSIFEKSIFNQNIYSPAGNRNFVFQQFNRMIEFSLSKFELVNQSISGYPTNKEIEELDSVKKNDSPKWKKEVSSKIDVLGKAIDKLKTDITSKIYKNEEDMRRDYKILEDKTIEWRELRRIETRENYCDYIREGFTTKLSKIENSLRENTPKSVFKKVDDIFNEEYLVISIIDPVVINSRYSERDSFIGV